MTEELDLKKFYTRMPGSIRFNRKLPYGARLLWGDLRFLCERTGCCWWPNSKLAALYGVSERTIINWLDALEKEGLLTRAECTHPDTQQLWRKIVLTDIKLYENMNDAEEQPEEEPEPEPNEDFQGEAQENSEGYENNFTPIYRYSNNSNTKNTNTFKELNKITDSRSNVKRKFNDFEQRDYSPDFYAALLHRKMCGSG